MNWSTIEGKWDKLKGSIRVQWGELTDDDLAVVAGKRDRLIGKLEERYGLSHEAAERQVERWSNETVNAHTTEARN